MDAFRSIVSTVIVCQPGYMARGRYKQRKVAKSREAVGAAQAGRPSPEPTPGVTAESARPLLDTSVKAIDGSAFRRSSSSEAPLSPSTAPTPVPTSRRVPPTAPAPWQEKKAQLSDLKRLREISKSLARLHRDEAILLDQRDALIAQLRKQDVSWSSLAMRTGLSRQALSKRMG